MLGSSMIKYQKWNISFFFSVLLSLFLFFLKHVVCLCLSWTFFFTQKYAHWNKPKSSAFFFFACTFVRIWQNWNNFKKNTHTIFKILQMRLAIKYSSTLKKNSRNSNDKRFLEISLYRPKPPLQDTTISDRLYKD